MNDLKFAIRQLLKNPGFTVVAVLTLALGIGADTAIFQLLNAIRLRSLPVRRPQELVVVQIRDMEGARGNFNSPYPSVTNPLWERVRRDQQAFSGVFAWSPASFRLEVGDQKRSVRGMWASGDAFNSLGIAPIAGRFFTPQDDRRGAAAVAVVSHAFWRREFAGDPATIGKRIILDGQAVEIIGVTPATFAGLEIGRPFDVALPLNAEAVVAGANHRLDAGTTWWLTVMGRLKPGWSLEKASAHLASISSGIFQEALPANYPSINVTNYLGFKLEAKPSGTGVSTLREEYSKPLWILFAIAGSVLLIACANLANLLFARASAREREMVVRLALGASRGRLVWQLLVESLLVAALGAGLGWLLAGWLSRVLVAFLSTAGNALFVDLGLDWHMFAFTGGLAVLTCLIFGLAPALRGTRGSPGAALKAGGRGMTASREKFGLRRALVVSQVALSLLLVMGALLFSRSLGNLMALDAGFQQDGILVARVDYSALHLPAERRQGFRREMLEKLRAIPGVEAAADTSVAPLEGSARGNRAWMDGGRGEAKECLIATVGPDYFKTLNSPLLAGREFGPRDDASASRVAVVNESFARQVAGGTMKVGESLWIESTPWEPETRCEIVGMVKDSKYRDLREENEPIVFLAATQEKSVGEGDKVLIRSSMAPAALIAATRSALKELHPAIEANCRMFKSGIQETLMRERLMARLSEFFGLLALVLACLGLYGILSYGVASRTNEIGLRMALGARRGSVLWMILREAVVLVALGVLAGLPAVWAVTRLISGLLFGLAPFEPALAGAAALLMFAVAMLAGFIPARRAAGVDPMVALRDE